MQDLIIVGAGGHGREIVSLVKDLNRQNLAFNLLGVMADEAPNSVLLEKLGVDYLGAIPTSGSFGAAFVVGIGAPEVRERVAQQITHLGGTAVALVHPSASIGDNVAIAPGAVVFAGVVVTTNVRIGSHCHLNVNSSVSHDCFLHEFTTISPGAVVCGSVTIGRRAFIGANACILQGLDVGDDSIVGAGALVTKNVERSATVIGVPAQKRNT